MRCPLVVAPPGNVLHAAANPHAGGGGVAATHWSWLRAWAHARAPGGSWRRSGPGIWRGGDGAQRWECLSLGLQGCVLTSCYSWPLCKKGAHTEMLDSFP
eukprot:scaffold118654_cov15-Tisochrysis_lutea.AAC.1